MEKMGFIQYHKAKHWREKKSIDRRHKGNWSRSTPFPRWLGPHLLFIPGHQVYAEIAWLKSSLCESIKSVLRSQHMAGWREVEWLRGRGLFIYTIVTAWSQHMPIHAVFVSHNTTASSRK